MNLEEAKIKVIGSLNNGVSNYAFKSDVWGTPCNCAYVKNDEVEGFFILKEEQGVPMLISSDGFLNANQNYIMTNLTNRERTTILEKIKYDDWFENY